MSMVNLSFWVTYFSAIPLPKLLKANGVGFKGDDGGEGLTREEPLEAEDDVMDFVASIELNTSDGEKNLDAPADDAWAAKDVKKGDIIDDIDWATVDAGFTKLNGDLKSPKCSRLSSVLTTSWSSGWSSGSESSLSVSSLMSSSISSSSISALAFSPSI